MAKTQAWKNARKRKRREKTRKRKETREQDGVRARLKGALLPPGFEVDGEQEQKEQIIRLLNLTPWKKR